MKTKSRNRKLWTSVRNLDFVEGYGKYELQQSNIVGELIKFIKGTYYAGPDQKEIELGTKMIVNGDSMKLGWQLWSDERVVDYVMGELVKGFQPPKREELSFPPDVKTGKNAEWPLDDNGNPSDPWRYTVQVLMKDMDGELYTFAIGSKGGRSAIGKLCLAWSQKMREGFNVYPVVELQADTYKHKKLFPDRHPGSRDRGLAADRGLRLGGCFRRSQGPQAEGAKGRQSRGGQALAQGQRRQVRQRRQARHRLLVCVSLCDLRCSSPKAAKAGANIPGEDSNVVR